MPCAYMLVRPTTYTLQYRCACGWASDTVPGDQIGMIGAQLVRHVKELL